MIVAIDTDSVPPRQRGDVALDRYVRLLVGALASPSGEGPVHRIVLLTNPENHARFDTLRDERCDVAMVHRPLFEGRPVGDWPALLSRYAQSGLELLAGHLHEKLRIVRELGADVVHVPGDASEAMNHDMPVVVSPRGDCPLSATLAHAVIAPSADVKERLCRTCGVSPDKVFVAHWDPSSYGPDLADDQGARAAFAAAVCEAYEHALASFELRDAA